MECGQSLINLHHGYMNSKFSVRFNTNSHTNTRKTVMLNKYSLKHVLSLLSSTLYSTYKLHCARGHVYLINALDVQKISIVATN